MGILYHQDSVSIFEDFASVGSGFGVGFGFGLVLAFIALVAL